MVSTVLRRYLFGILPRYVLRQVVSSFTLAVFFMTAVFVLIMVMNQAVLNGLTPMDVLRLTPLIIPVTLPYTVPVSLLFAVTLVYGRLAGDNEIIAVKTAGVGIGGVMCPSLVFGLVLGAVLAQASNDWIPRAGHNAKSILFANLEDYFYKILAKNHEWNQPRWPFFISVRDVKGKTMYDAVFKRRADPKVNPDGFDLWIDAKSATIRFDSKAGVAHVYLVGSEARQAKDGVFLINKEKFDIPIAEGPKPDLKVQELTSKELIDRQARDLWLLDVEPKRQATAAALWIASGRLERVDWEHVRGVWKDRINWYLDYCACETEKQLRLALALGGFLFVLIGAPVGILFAKRDPLSAFMTCFVPIILVYYPLTLLGANLGKDGVISAWFVYLGDAALLLLALFVALPPVRKH